MTSGAFTHSDMRPALLKTVIVLAVLADLSVYSGGAYGNRDRVPGYGRTP